MSCSSYYTIATGVTTIVTIAAAITDINYNCDDGMRM
jgi:hypothetical protein